VTHKHALAISTLWKGKEKDTDQRGNARDGRREEWRRKVIADPLFLIWYLEKEGSGRHDSGGIENQGVAGGDPGRGALG